MLKLEISGRLSSERFLENLKSERPNLGKVGLIRMDCSKWPESIDSDSHEASKTPVTNHKFKS